MAPADQSPLTSAIALHRAGRLAEAANAYRLVLSADPQNADALHLLGVALLQQRKFAEGLVLIERAIGFDPKPARYYEALGEGLAASGLHARALKSFEEAATRGSDSPGFHFNLGLTALKAEQPEKAEPALRALLAASPDHIDGLVNLAAALKTLNRPDESEPLLRRALQLAPDNLAALNNLAMVLRDSGHFDEAARHVARAIELNPTFIDALATHASILAERLRIPEAIAAYERVITVDPMRAKSYSALSALFHEQRKFDAALAANARAIEIDPNHAESHFNRALFLFAQGRLAEGWREYEWRWRTPSVPSRWRPFPQPRWQGETLRPDKKLLVWSEQGVGDEIMYASMLPDLAARGFDIVFECDERLVPLFARSFPKMTVVPRRDSADPATADPAIAAQISAGGLGPWLRPAMASFPARGGFLVADAKATADFRKRVLGRSKDKVIGISWLSQNRAHAAHKSAGLDLWRPILDRKGARFVDLQYGETATERAGTDIVHFDDLDSRQDLDRLSALIGACDLVVTVCNTTAHLAASLGKPVWILVPYERGRLWWTFLEWADSPWYASARLFRQTDEGDWRTPIAAIAGELDGKPPVKSPANPPGKPGAKSKPSAKSLTRKKN